MPDEIKKERRRSPGSGQRAGPRPYRRNGQFFNCTVCGEEFYRKASFIARGITKTCGKRECISVSMQKEKNPFWGKEHSPEVRQLLSEAKAAMPKPRKRSGPPPGWKPSAEQRASQAASMRLFWANNRDVMLAHLPKIPKPREEQRYRKCFTPWQRRNWKAEECAWCRSTEGLQLDHVISVMDGGLNMKQNAQTLCQPCNLWKSIYVDRPSHLARLALKGGLVES